MDKNNNLELGNLLFNVHNANQKYPCPDWVVALLWDINREIERVYWNNNQEELDSCFYNNGSSYKSDAFEIRAYSWDDENKTDWNFKCGDVKISWYKHLGRDTTINIDPSCESFNTMMIDMYNVAIKDVRSKDMNFDV